MLWNLDLSSGEFCAFPRKQRLSILSADKKGASVNGISIKKQDTEEEASERSSAHFVVSLMLL